MRRFAPVLAVAAIAVSVLAGCSTTVNETRDNAGCGAYPSGKSSDAVRATGAAGAAPKVSFPSPLHSTGSQVTTLRTGSGRQMAEGDVATIGVTLATGNDGAVVERAGYETSSVLPLTARGDNSLDRSLECRRAGDRYALTTSIKAALGDSAASQLGVSPSLTVVLVVDVKKVFAGQADGANQLQDNSLPQVVTAVDGQPGIVLPNSTPPTTRQTWIVKQGSGPKLAKGTRTLMKFSAFTWADKATVAEDSTWTGRPAIYTAGDSSSAAPFAKALTGVRIGSQLMYVVPAANHQATVFVVDVLGRL